MLLFILILKDHINQLPTWSHTSSKSGSAVFHKINIGDYFNFSIFLIMDTITLNWKKTSDK